MRIPSFFYRAIIACLALTAAQAAAEPLASLISLNNDEAFIVRYQLTSQTAGLSQDAIAALLLPVLVNGPDPVIFGYPAPWLSAAERLLAPGAGASSRPWSQIIACLRGDAAGPVPAEPRSAALLQCLRQRDWRIYPLARPVDGLEAFGRWRAVVDCDMYYLFSQHLTAGQVPAMRGWLDQRAFARKGDWDWRQSYPKRDYSNRLAARLLLAPDRNAADTRALALSLGASDDEAATTDRLTLANMLVTRLMAVTEEPVAALQAVRLATAELAGAPLATAPSGLPALDRRGLAALVRHQALADLIERFCFQPGKYFTSPTKALVPHLSGASRAPLIGNLIAVGLHQYRTTTTAAELAVELRLEMARPAEERLPMAMLATMTASLATADAGLGTSLFESLLAEWRATFADPARRSVIGLHGLRQCALNLGRVGDLSGDLAAALRSDPANPWLIAAIAIDSATELDLAGLTPASVATVPEVDVASTGEEGWPGTNGAKQLFAMVYRGSIRIDVAGSYGFATESDDGSWLSLAERQIVANGGQHGLERRAATVVLASGSHPLVLTFCQLQGGGGCRLLWKPPGAAEWSVIPSTCLRTASGDAGLSAEFFPFAGRHLWDPAAAEAAGFRAVYQQMPWHAGAALQQTWWLLQREQPATALPIAESVLAMGNPRARKHIGLAKGQLGERAESRRLLEAHAAEHGTFGEYDVLFMLARFADEDDDVQTATRWYHELEETRSSTAVVAAGRFYRRRGMHERAKNCFTVLVQHQDSTGTIELAKCLLAQVPPDIPGAVALVTKVPHAPWVGAECLRELPELAAKAGAAPDIAKALDLQAEASVTLRVTAAVTHLTAGHLRLAAERFETLAQDPALSGIQGVSFRLYRMALRPPGSPRPWRSLRQGVAVGQAGDLGELFDRLDRPDDDPAITPAGPEWISVLALTRGLCLLADGDVAAARQRFDACTKGGANQAPIAAGLLAWMTTAGKHGVAQSLAELAAPKATTKPLVPEF